jgi:ABC-type sulfate/molybdate transport systems ATPase subunit
LRVLAGLQRDWNGSIAVLGEQLRQAAALKAH